MNTIFWANCNKQGKVSDYQGFTAQTKMSRNNGQIMNEKMSTDFLSQAMVTLLGRKSKNEIAA